jgi:hypothetical protein
VKVACTLAGIAASIKIIELPNLPERGDVTDWIEAHGEAAEPQTFREELEALVRQSEEYQTQGENETTPILISMADIQAKPVDYLWNNRIALGRITLFVGEPGAGKSITTMDWASRVSTGTLWPDGMECQKGSVLLGRVDNYASQSMVPAK